MNGDFIQQRLEVFIFLFLFFYKYKEKALNFKILWSLKKVQPFAFAII